MKISAGLICAILVGTLLTPARAENVQAASLLERRGAEICAEFRTTPGDYDKLFAAEFLAQVSAAQLNAIFGKYFHDLGRCTSAKLVKASGDYAGDFEFIFERGFTVPGKMSATPNAPNLIAGFWLGNAVSQSASLDDIVRELKTFSGETSFTVARLNGESINPVVSYNAERDLGIGSAFKLYVLSELTREVNNHERKLSDVVNLDGRYLSKSGGTLETWPAGSPLTLHTLAALMISISDNTAADELLMTLGRERVERIMSATGHSKPELNVPFLATMEMFKLKGEPTHKMPDQYLALDAPARRRFLSEQVAAVRRDEINPYADGKPAYLDRIEWFASVSDLCRVMNWLRLQTESNLTAAPLRDVLAINPGSGLNVSRNRWSYIGYKGGSEPGALNMTYLLRSTKGQWYAMAMTWNDTKAPLDNSKMFALVQRALQIIE